MQGLFCPLVTDLLQFYSLTLFWMQLILIFLWLLALSTQCFKDNLDLTPMPTPPTWLPPAAPGFCVREHQEAQRVSRRSLACPHESKGGNVGCPCPPPKLYVDHAGLLPINLLWSLCFLCLAMVKPCLLPLLQKRTSVHTVLQHISTGLMTLSVILWASALPPKSSVTTHVRPKI